jgi:hypothetical protein
MPKKEYLREPMDELPTPNHFQARLAAGWKLVALEWERSRDEATGEPSRWEEAIPYGLQISEDCSRLVENPSETQVIVAALAMIVDDHPLSRVAVELNRREYTTREGKSWTMTALFDLLPRMIQVSPRVFSSEQWVTRRLQLPRVV